MKPFEVLDVVWVI